MFKGALVGAIALTTGMIVSLASAQTAQAEPLEQDGGPSSGIVVKHFHIERLRSALNLTPEQRPYWAPVEAALRDMARQSREMASADGFMQRMNDRARSVASDAMRLRRLAAAARPLIKTLDEQQKREAMMLARHYGFDRLVAAF